MHCALISGMQISYNRTQPFVAIMQINLIAFNALTLLTGLQGEHLISKKLSDEMLAWLSVWSKVQMICLCPADATATPSSLASLESRLV